MGEKTKITEQKGKLRRGEEMEVRKEIEISPLNGSDMNSSFT